MEPNQLDHDEEVLVDAPPPYNDPKTKQSSAAGPSRQLPDVKTSNFVQLSRVNDWLRGSWIINPAMLIPSAFLPPLAPGDTEETRSNISLDITRRGSIHADIFLLSMSLNESTSAQVQRRRIYIKGSTCSGNVTMKLHEIPPEKPTESRWPMQVNCSSAYGSVALYLPRSFHGPINFRVTNGRVHFSNAMKTMVTLFSDNDGVQRSFLGDFDATAIQNAGEWTGDSLSAEAVNGSIRIYFDDEDVPSPAPKVEAKGFIERWFDS